MSSILDIEGTIETGNQYMMEHWYWNTFLPFIDRINIEEDYYYIYRDFDIDDLISKGLSLINEKEVILKWMCDNDIAKLSSVTYLLDEDKHYIECEPVFCTVPKTKLILNFKDKFYYDLQRVSFSRFSSNRKSCKNYEFPLNCAIC